MSQTRTVPSPARVAVLAGIGSYLPPRSVSNAELAGYLDTSDEWIRSRTGISRRRVIDAGTATSDLASAAGRQALRCAGLDTVDAVVVATTTPDRRCPATAPTVAAKLGLADVAAFDVSAVCTGFVYAMATGSSLIAAGVVDSCLIICAEIYSTIVDQSDRTNAAIFGDAAAAVVLKAGSPDEPGAVGPFDLGSDGGGRDLITVRAGGTELPLSPETAQADRFFAMSGAQVFQLAVRHMVASARAVMQRAQLNVEQVDHFVGHQANGRILHRVADGLGLPAGRSLSNIGDVGNTAAASIPLALDQAHHEGRLRVGDRVLVTAFGGGLTWGATTFTWPDLACQHSTET